MASLTTRATPSREEMSRLLAETRHPLVHQLPLPSCVMLVDKAGTLPAFAASTLDLCIIGIADLTLAVRPTAEGILESHADAVFDPS